jgi:anion-transporting  ArsA/GET3 family ATPase
MEDLTSVEKRQDRIEIAITRLTEISSDLNKMLAVHEQRLLQQEKNMDNIEEVLERRREESDIKLKDVYETMRSEDNKILNELNAMRKESTEQHNKLTERLTSLENKVFLYIGGISVIVFLLTYGPNILKFLSK